MLHYYYYLLKTIDNKAIKNEILYYKMYFRGASTLYRYKVTWEPLKHIKMNNIIRTLTNSSFLKLQNINLKKLNNKYIFSDNSYEDPFEDLISGLQSKLFGITSFLQPRQLMKNMYVHYFHH